MHKDRSSYEQSYQKLRVAFLQRLEKDAGAIESLFVHRKSEGWTKEEAEKAMYLAHGLAGSGSLFGYPEVSQKGRAADKFLAQILPSLSVQKNMSAEDSETLDAMLRGLQRVCVESTRILPESPEIALPEKRISIRRNENLSVLLIEDDSTTSEFISMNLRQSGLRVTAVKDGESAIVALASAKPDLVILDIHLPRMDGHEVLRRIKSNPETVGIPVLVLTAKTEEKHIVSALHAGAIDYIVKPFDSDKLSSRVEKILDARKYSVFIVDNDILVLQILSQKFAEQGFKVMVSEDGKEALNLIQKYLPDLVILDRMMPGMEGLAILKRIREEEATQAIPVIVLSARGQPTDIQKGIEMGAQAYFTKPFQSEELIEKSLELLMLSEANSR